MDYIQILGYLMILVSLVGYYYNTSARRLQSYILFSIANLYWVVNAPQLVLQLSYGLYLIFCIYGLWRIYIGADKSVLPVIETASGDKLTIISSNNNKNHCRTPNRRNMKIIETAVFKQGDIICAKNNYIQGLPLFFKASLNDEKGYSNIDITYLKIVEEDNPMPPIDNLFTEKEINIIKQSLMKQVSSKQVDLKNVDSILDKLRWKKAD